jgi:DNA repair exonuclease SbcCD ATPase subunit
MTNLERFEERLRNEDAMKDTIPFQSPANVIGQLDREIAENALLRRSLSVLTSRIEELERQLKQHRSEWLNESESDNTKLRAALAKVGELVDCFEAQEQRIASVLRTFYYAELTLSNVQPLLALCVELNPDIIEQRR